jgi:aerobic-type carbon monoxide dehydrogenase small subunit (CoxS/CutS family)
LVSDYRSYMEFNPVDEQVWGTTVVKLTVNDVDVDVEDRHAKTPLLWVLRDVLGMRGTKFGCGAGFCAACTVLIDGRNVKSCQTATEQAVGKGVTTVEGASGPVVDAVRDAWHRATSCSAGTASRAKHWLRCRFCSQTHPLTRPRSIGG